MNYENSKPYTERDLHRARVSGAVAMAEAALESARKTNRRTDCLTNALESLRGALRCVEWEDGQVK